MEELLRQLISGQKQLFEGQNQIFDRMGNLETKFDKLDAKVDMLEEKVDKLDVRLTSVENKVDILDAKVDKLADCTQQDVMAMLQRTATKDDIAKVLETQQLHTEWLRTLSADVGQHDAEIKCLKVAK